MFVQAAYNVLGDYHGERISLKSVLDRLTYAGNEYWESKPVGKHQRSTKPDKPASGNSHQAATKSSGSVSHKNQGADSQARTVAAE